MNIPTNYARNTVLKSEITKHIKSNPITGLDRPWGFQKVEASRFQDNRLSVLRTGRLYPRKYSWYSYLLDAESNPGLEGLCQWKIAITPSGIEPATLQFVAQCLNQLRHRVPHETCRRGKEMKLHMTHKFNIIVAGVRITVLTKKCNNIPW
jgi:hypothetical protein